MLVMEFGKELYPLIVVFVTIWKSLVITRQEMTELFNLHHSSLFTSIERCFGVLKICFCVLDVEPFWSFPAREDVILACCIIHNHIIGVDPLDSIMSNELRGYLTCRTLWFVTMRPWCDQTPRCAMKNDIFFDSNFHWPPLLCIGNLKHCFFSWSISKLVVQEHNLI